MPGPARTVLLARSDPDAPFLYADGTVVTVAQFLRRVAVLAATLPAAPALNLCERRDHFLAAWCAVAARGQLNLLPPARAPAVVRDVQAAHAGSYRLDDERVARALAGLVGGPGPRFESAESPADGTAGGWGAAAPAVPAAPPTVGEHQLVQVAYTSGSTGQPAGHARRWGGLRGNSARSAARIREYLAPRHGAARPTLVGTVPPQHTWGAETTLLLPLLEDMAVHGGRPLFPADVAAALAAVPEPCVLVTTPVHLRMLVAARLAMPPVALVLSATAPLDAALAARAEQLFNAPLLEVFGSTETCAIASRRTASEPHWTLYPDVEVRPLPDHARVDAPWFEQPVALPDRVELLPGRGMRLLGRNADLVEIAGKRASLADITRRLLAVPGVHDAVVIQLQPGEAGHEAGPAGAAGVQRLAALVAANGIDAAWISAQLAQALDPVFLPRPLRVVDSLPRNDVGKIDRSDLLRGLFPPD